MGNVIAAPIPSRILPVEDYINDIQDMNFVQSLGSTRFMKVARVKLKDGPAVCKVFLPYDPSFSVSPYMEQVVRIKNSLSGEPNCLPFEKVHLTPRCAVLLRQFQKQTLYERLGTRPFLTDVEKKWIAFQLFKAVAQCEAAGVCHGDLKTQNVLVSSSTWICITDFASYKPACIPSDDPSYFHFFFDTSRRLSCYLAPERFQPSQELKTHPALPGEFMDVSKGLTPAMDIFSLGCVLIELFTEGRFPFTYERIIRYKYSDMDGASQLVHRILEYVPEEWREVIGLMLDRNPARRPQLLKLVSHRTSYRVTNECSPQCSPERSAHDDTEQLTERYGIGLFPSVFDRFIYNYMLAFRPRFVTPGAVSEEQPDFASAAMEPDDVIARLHSDLDMIIEKLCQYSDTVKTGAEQTCTSVLFISLVTSNIRTLRTLTAKLTAMKILERLSLISDPCIVADRVIPYLVKMNFLQDHSVQARVAAIYSVTAVLSSFKEIPVNENRLFVDYVFPKLKTVSMDRAVLARMSLALNLGELAETSVKFLTQSSSTLTDDFLGGSLADEIGDKGKKEEVLTRQELEALHDAVNEIFVNLCGSDNNVKLCLVVPQSLEKLCLFFHRQKSTDVLLSHMITFLNDKVDWRLRATFFQCCTITAKYVGRQSAFMLRSLLQQGLHDYEEFVQLNALHCIYELCKEQLLDKASIFELLPDVVPFLAHPNEWLRLAVVNIICVLDDIMNIADVYCRLAPAVKPYLEENLIRLNKKFIITTCLKPFIPRNIWSYIVEKTPVNDLLNYLTEKRLLIALDGGPQSIFASNRSLRPAAALLKPYLERLKNLGLNDDYEEKLIKFCNILMKMHSFRSSICANPVAESENEIIDLKSLPSPLSLHGCDLEKTDLKNVGSNVKLLESTEPKDVFGSASDIYRRESTASCGYIGLGLPLETIRSSASNVQLTELLTHKRERYLKRRKLVARTHSSISSTIDQSKHSSVPSPSRGTKLLAHLHEHNAAVTSMALSAAGTDFASASNDGTIKLWSVPKLTSQLTAAIRADGTYAYRRKVYSIEYLRHTGDHLAIASEDRLVNIIDTRRLVLVKRITLKEEDGPPVQLFGADNLLYVLSHHGNVYCLDCRTASENLMPLWEYKAKDRYGLITSFCVDPGGRNWMSLTSTGGDVILWDLRFGLEVKNWQLSGCRLLKCWPAHPVHSKGSFKEIWTASSSNGELSRWNLETGERSHAIWPCPGREIFSYDKDSKLVTISLATCSQTGRIFTGDTVGAIRSYDLGNEKACYYLSGPERRTADDVSSNGDSISSVKFDRTMVKTVDVIYELPRISRQRHSSTTSCTSPLDNQVTICHRSPISGIICHGEFLISSSRDGIIKVWR